MNFLERIKLAARLIEQQGGQPAELHIHPSTWARAKKQIEPALIGESVKTKRGRPVTTLACGQWDLEVVTDNRLDAPEIRSALGSRVKA